MHSVAEALRLYFNPLSKYQIFGDDTHHSQPFWLYRQASLNETGVIKFIKEVDISNSSQEVKCLIYCIRSLLNLSGKACLSSMKVTEKDDLLTLLTSATYLSTYARSVWISLSLRDPHESIRDDAIEYMLSHYRQFTKNCYIDLSFANFTGLHQRKKSKFDFTGQYLYGSNFSENLSLKGTKFKYACLSHANFQGANAKNAFFQGAWLDKASFHRAILDNADFAHTQGLTQNQLQDASSINKIALTPLKTHISEMTIATQIQQAAVRHAERETRMPLNSPASMNWPKDADRWNHDDKWNGKGDGQICRLSEEDPLFKIISHMVYVSSDNISVKNTWLLNHQFQTAVKNFSMKDIGYSIMNTPQYVGFVGSITIKSIDVVRNPFLWQRYQDEKSRIASTVNHDDLTVNANYFPWSSPVIWPLPLIDTKVGECLLFHGVREVDVMALITQGGYKTEFMKQSSLNGWGELGKGIYLAEEFSKSALHVFCPQCKVSPCRCPDDKKPELKMFLNRALLGRIKEDRYHESRWSEVGKGTYHSSWGPRPSVTNSEFKYNEFCVPPHQVYPEFIITYQENKKEYQLQLDTHLPTPEDWQESLKRGNLDKNETPLLQIVHLLDNYHRLLCYRKNDKWSLEWQLESIEQVLTSVYGGSPESLDFDQLETARNLNIKIKLERKRLGLAEAGIDSFEDWHLAVLQLYQEVHFEYANKNYDKALPVLLKLIAKMPYTYNFRWLLASIYHHLGVFSQPLMVQTIHRSLLQNEVLTRQFLHSNDSLTTAQYYEASLVLLRQNQSVSDNTQENKLWVNDVLMWHIETHLALDLKKREFYDGLPENIQPLFRDCVLRNIDSLPSTDRNQVIREWVLHWPDKDGNRPSTIKNKENWQRKLKDELTTEVKSGVSLHWLHGATNDYQITSSYLKPIYAKCLLKPNGDLEPHAENYEQEGHCLVKALCDTDNQPIAYVKLFPRYPLRQQFSDELCYRLSGHGAMTSIGLLVDENSKKIYPVIISQPLGIAPSPDEPKQRNLLSWECYGKDKDIENMLDGALFTWKVIETFLLQPKDDKNDNLFPFLNSFTNEYGLISGDADRILSRTPMQGDVVHLNSNILLMDAMDEKLDPVVVKHFLSLDFKMLLNGIIEHFKQVESQLVTLHEICSKINNSVRFEDFETGRPIKINNQLFHTESHLFKLFRDNDLPELYQRSVLLRKVLLKMSQQEPMTATELFSELMPHCATAYQMAKAADPKIKTSSQRYGHLNNLCKKKSKVTRIKAPDGKGTLLITTTFSATEIKPTNMLGRLLKSKSEPANISRISQQASYIQGIEFYLNNVTKIIEEIAAKGKLDTFTRQDTPDYVRETVWNQLDWANLNQTTKANLLKLLPTFKCVRLRLAHCDVTTKLFVAHLRYNTDLKELYLVDCRNIDQSAITMISKMPSLRRLVISAMNWRVIRCENAYNPDILPRLSKKWIESFYNLRDLKITDCPNLLDFHLYAPQLQKLSLSNCQIYVMKSEILNRYASTLTHLHIDNVAIDKNQLHDLTLNKLRTIECHNEQLISIRINAKRLRTVNFSGCRSLNSVKIASEKLIYLDSSVTNDMLESIVLSIEVNNVSLLMTNSEKISLKSAIEKIQKGAHHIHNITKFLTYPLAMNISPLKRLAAIRGLGKLKYVSPDVIHCLLYDFLGTDKNISAAAKDALVALKNDNINVDDIIIKTMIGVNNNNLRIVAACALRKLQDVFPVVFTSMRALVDRPETSYHVRREIANLIVCIHQDNPEIIRNILKLLRLMNDELISDQRITRAIISALGKLKNPSDEVIQYLLSRTLNDSNRISRTACAASLIRIGVEDPRVIEVLMSALKIKNNDPYNYISAANALGKLKTPSIEVIQNLKSHLRDKNSILSIASASALVRLGFQNREVVDVLLAAIQHENESFMFATIERALGELKNPSTDVIQALLSTSNFYSDKVLIKLGEDNLKTTEAILAAFRDKDNSCDIRQAAVSALIKLEHKCAEIGKALIAALADEDQFIRFIAANAMIMLKEEHPEFIEPLFTALNNALNFSIFEIAQNIMRALIKHSKENPRVIKELLTISEDKPFPYFIINYSLIPALSDLKRPNSEVIEFLLSIALQDKNTKKLIYDDGPLAYTLITLLRRNHKSIDPMLSFIESSVLPSINHRVSQLEDPNIKRFYLQNIDLEALGELCRVLQNRYIKDTKSLNILLSEFKQTYLPKADTFIAAQNGDLAPLDEIHSHDPEPSLLRKSRSSEFGIAQPKSPTLFSPDVNYAEYHPNEDLSNSLDHKH